MIIVQFLNHSILTVHNLLHQVHYKRIFYYCYYNYYVVKETIHSFLLAWIACLIVSLCYAPDSANHRWSVPWVKWTLRKSTSAFAMVTWGHTSAQAHINLSDIQGDWFPEGILRYNSLTRPQLNLGVSI